MNGARDFYREFAPPPDLRHVVACLWIARADAVPVSHAVPIIPDGCADIFVRADDAPFVVGPATRTHWAVASPGVEIAALRLRPGAVPAVFGCRAIDLLDGAFALDAVCTDTRKLRDAVAAAADATTRCQALAAWVRDRLAKNARASLAIVAAADRLFGTQDLRVARLADDLGCNVRTLLRQFEAACGYGPKKLHRILRLQRAVGLVHAVPGASRLSAIAADAGYADQPHMTREFRDLTGFTLAAYLDSAPPPAGQWLAGGLAALPLSETFKTRRLVAR